MSSFLGKLVAGVDFAEDFSPFFSPDDDLCFSLIFSTLLPEDAEDAREEATSLFLDFALTPVE